MKCFKYHPIKFLFYLSYVLLSRCMMLMCLALSFTMCWHPRSQYNVVTLIVTSFHTTSSDIELVRGIHKQQVIEHHHWHFIGSDATWSIVCCDDFLLRFTKCHHYICIGKHLHILYGVKLYFWRGTTLFEPWLYLSPSKHDHVKETETIW